MKLFFSDYDMTIYIHEKIDDSVFDAIKNGEKLEIYLPLQQEEINFLYLNILTNMV